MVAGGRLRMRPRGSSVGVLVALLAITSCGGALRLIDIGRAGLGNEFYSAAVYSMGLTPHNFFYAAFDPAATLSVDKPPVALWL